MTDASKEVLVLRYGQLWGQIYSAEREVERLSCDLEEAKTALEKLRQFREEILQDVPDAPDLVKDRMGRTAAERNEG